MSDVVSPRRCLPSPSIPAGAAAPPESGVRPARWSYASASRRGRCSPSFRCLGPCRDWPSDGRHSTGAIAIRVCPHWRCRSYGSPLWHRGPARIKIALPHRMPAADPPFLGHLCQVFERVLLERRRCDQRNALRSLQIFRLIPSAVANLTTSPLPVCPPDTPVQFRTSAWSFGHTQTEHVVTRAYVEARNDTASGGGYPALATATLPNGHRPSP